MKPKLPKAKSKIRMLLTFPITAFITAWKSSKKQAEIEKKYSNIFKNKT